MPRHPMRKIEHVWTFSTGDFVGALAFSADGRYLAAGVTNDIFVCRVDDGGCVVLSGGVGKGTALWIAWENEMMIWWRRGEIGKYLVDLSKSELRELYAKIFGVGTECLAVHPGRGIMAIGRCQHEIAITEIDGEKQLAVINTYPECVREMVFSPGGNELIVAGQSLRAYGVPDGVLLWQRDVGPRKISVSPGGQHIAIGNKDVVELINISDGQVVCRSEESRGPVICVAYSPSGRLLVSADVTGITVLRDPNTLSPVGVIVEDRGVSRMAISPKDNYLATGGYEGTVHLYQIA